jgi:hypothetical protein
MKQFAELDQIIQEQNQVKLTDSFSYSWNDFKRQAGPYLGFTVLAFLISFIIAFIPFGSLIVSPFIGLGYATFLYEERMNRNTEFGNFFKSFQKFGDVILTYLLTLVAYFIAAIPLMFLGGIAFFRELAKAQTNPMGFDPVFTTGLIAGILVTIVLFLIIAACTHFATYFAYFYDVKPIEAIKLSVRMGLRNFGHMILLFLFSGFVAAIGAILCGVGLLVTLPIASLIIYYTFEGITKLEKNNDPDFDFDNTQKK